MKAAHRPHVPAPIRIGVLVLLAIACADSRPRHDVLLVTIDTLRADYVRAYGFDHETTPQIDALAARGFLFEHAVAAASLTAPAHASIMTSRFVRRHSIGTLNGDTRLEGGTTLAERFHDAGYETAAFVSNVVLRRRAGFDRGFGVYDDELASGEANRPAYFERIAEDTVGAALDWLADRHERPIFLWVHLQDPHGPYRPPEGFAGRIGDVPLRYQRPLPVLAANFGRAGIPDYQKLDELRMPAAYAGRYAEEILYVDHWLGRLVEAFEGNAASRGGVVLLTADHGESMGEAGFFFQHGQATTPDLALVPMVIAAPGLPSGRSRAWVSHVDVAPTLLELAGIDTGLAGDGLSLVPLMRRGAALPERAVYCDTDGESALYTAGRFTRIGGGIAADRATGKQDPLQIATSRLGDDGEWRQDETSGADREQLLRYLGDRVPLVAAEAMAPEHIEQLRALGYLPPQDDADTSPSAD